MQSRNLPSFREHTVKFNLKKKHSPDIKQVELKFVKVEKLLVYHADSDHINTIKKNFNLTTEEVKIALNSFLREEQQYEKYKKVLLEPFNIHSGTLGIAFLNLSAIREADLNFKTTEIIPPQTNPTEIGDRPQTQSLYEQVIQRVPLTEPAKSQPKRRSKKRTCQVEEAAVTLTQPETPVSTTQSKFSPEEIQNFIRAFNIPEESTKPKDEFTKAYEASFDLTNSSLPPQKEIIDAVNIDNQGQNPSTTSISSSRNSFFSEQHQQQNQFPVNSSLTGNQPLYTEDTLPTNIWICLYERERITDLPSQVLFKLTSDLKTYECKLLTRDNNQVANERVVQIRKLVNRKATKNNGRITFSPFHGSSNPPALTISKAHMLIICNRMRDQFIYNPTRHSSSEKRKLDEIDEVENFPSAKQQKMGQ